MEGQGGSSGDEIARGNAGNAAAVATAKAREVRDLLYSRSNIQTNNDISTPDCRHTKDQLPQSANFLPPKHLRCGHQCIATD